MAADPAFLFYVKDWRSSRRVQSMTFAQRGMYFEMLLEQWETGSAPATAAACAERLGGTRAEWTRAWPRLAACFAARKRDGRLVNARMEAVRRERERYRKSQSESGLRGAKARWGHDGKPIGSPQSANGELMANDGPRSSSSSGSSSSSSQTGTAPSPPSPTARSKRPIFTGQRLVVFEWQLDDLGRMLGPHTSGFDLQAWFSSLDARAVASQAVIPQRDGGAWLQAQTLAEAQRRGLPIVASAATPTTGRQTARLMSALQNIHATEGRQ